MEDTGWSCLSVRRFLSHKVKNGETTMIASARDFEELKDAPTYPIGCSRICV